ncbi:aminopeptidase PepB [Aestuariibacter sp. AA17]|uniref:Aminopeptidase PepB n=1 Tax=Fluctibacter corallii TaxID=2984329 RepID=A0ABT3AAF1_9ALTE|nr:aminopeptidase PepB [Aestuariibacter sp. AA17]MCV2885649.1 aminopeptidase PepB [Aestuariibacter sp. AA17]
MSQFTVSLSHQAASATWGEKALISLAENGATVHIDESQSQREILRQIRKASRQLETLKLPSIALTGDWTAEQQWAFASSFGGPKRIGLVTFCENEDKQQLDNQYQALTFTREVINGTPEDISPKMLAEKAAQWLTSLAPDSVSYRLVEGEALQDEGWTGIYNVGRGSERPPVLLELDYNPSGDASAAVDAALVGKGITFDSGGYSIKSSEGMLDMKCDMGGAATVTGGLGLAIMQGVQKRIKLFLCCAENLISGHAYKLGDILTYKNGLTVEIVNTDAEGRLVLADGLMAASETGAPFILNAATLTGAAVVALGSDYNGLFGLDSELQKRVMNYADDVNELVWPLPLEQWHQEKCPSQFADTANSRPQKGGGGGGASNAAGFLSRFVDNNGKGWVHMDLAAAYNANGNEIMPAGASGLGVRVIAKALMEE